MFQIKLSPYLKVKKSVETSSNAPETERVATCHQHTDSQSMDLITVKPMKRKLTELHVLSASCNHNACLTSEY